MRRRAARVDGNRAPPGEPYAAELAATDAEINAMLERLRWLRRFRADLWLAVQARAGEGATA